MADTWRLSVRSNASATSVLPADLHFRVVEYVLAYPSFYLSTVSQDCIGANLDQGSNKNLTVTRRYLDPNRVSYEVIFFFVYL